MQNSETIRAVFCGDWHYGLRVEDMDRTPEINAAVEKAVDWAIAEKVHAFFGMGDFVHTNRPDPDHLALIMQQIRRLDDAGIRVFFMGGNHGAVATEKYWCYTPLERAKYRNVTFVKRPELHVFMGHPFIFLPHVMRATVLREAPGRKISPQTYVEEELLRLFTEAEGAATVVSHVNMPQDGLGGTEQYMLKQSALKVPYKALTMKSVIAVFNGHVHTPQNQGKIYCTGSIVSTDFGDTGKKSFIYGELPPIPDGYKYSKWKVQRRRTDAVPLQQYDFDFMGKTREEAAAMIAQAIESCPPDAIVRVTQRFEAERAAEFDFDYVQAFDEKCRYIKRVETHPVRLREYRDMKQKANLTPVQAIERFLKKRKPERTANKLALATRIITEGVPDTVKNEVHYESPATMEQEIDNDIDGLLADFE